jgi:hypothetical protein
MKGLPSRHFSIHFPPCVESGLACRAEAWSDPKYQHILPDFAHSTSSGLPPSADLNQPEAGKCARGAQACQRQTSLFRACFIRLWRTPTIFPNHQAIFFLVLISGIFLFSSLINDL